MQTLVFVCVTDICQHGAFYLWSW